MTTDPGKRRGSAIAMVLLALAVLLAVAGWLIQSRLTGSPPAQAGAASGTSPEVDYGFVELDHGGVPVAVASYKHGGAMQVRTGQTLRYEVIGEAPLPPIELHLAGAVTPLPGAAGQVRIHGPQGQKLPAVMRATGDRLSLPGGAPPRVSVKVQILADASASSASAGTP